MLRRKVPLRASARLTQRSETSHEKRQRQVPRLEQASPVAGSLLIPPGLSFWQALQRGYLRKPWHSRKYLAFVASLPCCITGRQPVTVHHIIGHGLEGQGTKTPDLLTIPLVAEYHLPQFPDGIHAIGREEWEALHGDQLVFVARTVLEAVYRGVLVVG